MRGGMINSASSLPTASCRLKPNTRSAAGLNSRTRPSASMVMMQSSFGIENAAIQHFELIARDRFAVFGPLVWISSGARRLARETNKFDAERAIALRGKRAILTAGMAGEEVVGKRFFAAN